MAIKTIPLGRRTVLKTLGASVVGGAFLPGTASARPAHYGNGNAIGAFLNEKAMFKESPVWNTGVADETGQTEVDVVFNALTDVINPGTGESFQGPWGVEPRAVKVSPGTEVTWIWEDHGVPHPPVPHDLVSFFDPPAYGDEFHEPGAPGDEFSYTFTDVGTYLYFCEPHGTPYEIFHPIVGGIVENLFGQRGVIKVVND